MSWVASPLARVAGWIVALLVVVILAIVGAQFVDRYFVDTGMEAPEQLARVAVVWLTFLAFALAVRDGATIRIDLLDRHLPASVNRRLTALFDLLILVLSGLMALDAWRVVEVGAMQELLGTPFTAALPNAGLLIGLLLVMLFTVERLLRGYGRASSGDTHDYPAVPPC